ncbi:hypothetical protein HDU79_006189 [Rhizoclosmatium sp. JEL0117]|nr:hypothetical protein HDU79_006189 [Rhizoclosmatium sp. JEL0117]
MPSLDQVLGSLQEAVTVTPYDDDQMDKPPEIVRVPLPDNCDRCSNPILQNIRKATVPDFSDEPEYQVPKPYAHNVVEYLQLKWNLITDEEQAHLVTDLEYWNGRHAAILPRIKLQRSDIQEHLEHIWNYFQPLGNYACEIMELVLFNLDEYPPSGVGAGERLAVLKLAADEFKNRLTDSKCARKLKDDKYAMGQIVKWLDSERSRNNQSLYDWMFPSLDTLLSLLDWVEKRPVGSAACDSRESITVDEALEDEEGAADVPDLPSINEADPLLGQKISTLSKVKGLHGRLSQIIIATIPAKIDIPSKAVSAGDWMKNAHQRYNSRRYEEDPDVMKRTFFQIQESRNGFLEFLKLCLTDTKRNTKGVRTWAMELLSNSAMNRGNEAVEANLSNLGYYEYDVAGIGKVPAILIMLQTWKTDSRVTLNAARFIGILSHPDSLQDAIGAMGIWMFDRFVWRFDLPNNQDKEPDLTELLNWCKKKIFPATEKDGTVAMSMSTNLRNVRARKEKLGLNCGIVVHEGRKYKGVYAIQHGATNEDIQSLGWWQQGVAAANYYLQIPKVDPLLSLIGVKPGEIYYNPRLKVINEEIEKAMLPHLYQTKLHESVTTRTYIAAAKFLVRAGLQCLASLEYRKLWDVKYSRKYLPFTHPEWENFKALVGEAEEMLKKGISDDELIADPRYRESPAMVQLFRAVKNENAELNQSVKNMLTVIADLMQELAVVKTNVERGNKALFELQTSRTLTPAAVPVPFAPPTPTPINVSSTSNYMGDDRVTTVSTLSTPVRQPPKPPTVSPIIKPVDIEAPEWNQHCIPEFAEYGLYIGYSTGPYNPDAIDAPPPLVKITKNFALGTMKNTMSMLRLLLRVKAVLKSVHQHSPHWIKKVEGKTEGAVSTWLSKITVIANYIEARAKSKKRSVDEVCAVLSGLDTISNWNQLYEWVIAFQADAKFAGDHGTPLAERMAIKRMAGVDNYDHDTDGAKVIDEHLKPPPSKKGKKNAKSATLPPKPAAVISTDEARQRAQYDTKIRHTIYTPRPILPKPPNGFDNHAAGTG